MRHVTFGLLLAVVLNPPTYSHAQVGAAAPRFNYSVILFCGDVFGHAANSSKTEYLRIEVDFARLERSGPRQLFDLADAPPNVVIEAAVYARPQINQPNCSDIIITETGQSPNPPDVWLAIAGTLEVERGPKGVRPEEPWLFKATLRLSNASFRGRQGTVVEMREVLTWEGFVGWQAGYRDEPSNERLQLAKAQRVKTLAIRPRTRG